MNINEMLLQEGIVFFKDSKRIENTISIFEKKLSKIKVSSDKRKDVELILSGLKDIYSKFKKLEDEYKTSKNKGKVKEKYKTLKRDNNLLLKKVNEESIKKTLKVLGLLSVIVLTIGFIANGISETSKEVVDKPEEDPLDKKQDPILANLETNDNESPIPFIEGEDDRNFVETRVNKAGIESNLSGKDSEGKYIDYKEKMRNDKLDKRYDAWNDVLKEKVPMNQRIKVISNDEGVDPKIIDAIIKKESSYRPDAVSPNGQDIGLMQLNSRYIDWFKEKFWYEKEKFDAKNPEHNAKVGIRYFKYLLKMFKGNTTLALQAYNAGPTAVKTGKVPKRTLAYAVDALKKMKVSTV